ncbi:MAG: hypothetical protein ACKN95_08415 [Holophagaceae bacterium]
MIKDGEVNFRMNETPTRCFLIAHQGPRESQDPIEDHLVELNQLAVSCGMQVVVLGGQLKNSG